MSSVSMSASAHRPGNSSQPGILCPSCHANLPALSEYCLHCGSRVMPVVAPREKTKVNPWRVGTRMALLAGLACLLAAALTGVFRQPGMAGWQAVQWWRVEWLLGSGALFALARVLQVESHRNE